MHVLVKFGTDACMLARIGRLQIALPETLYIVVPLKVAMTRLILTIRIKEIDYIIPDMVTSKAVV